MKSSNCFVIGVCGIMSSGKTSLIKELVKLQSDSISILWDDYDHLVKLDFEDPKKWVEEGCNTNKWITEQFNKDLCSLKSGRTIIHPTTKKEINPAKYIFVEEPTGRTRDEMRKLIDYLVFIELPPEISLARTFHRELNNSEKWKTAEELVSFLKLSTQRYLDWYHKGLQIIEKRIQEDANLIVNGLKPSAELAKIIVSKIHHF